MSESIIRPPQANPQLVAFLDKILAEAKAGRISSIACLIVSPLGNINVPAYGMQSSELYIGADLFKTALLNAMSRPASPGSVIRPS